MGACGSLSPHTLEPCQRGCSSTYVQGKLRLQIALGEDMLLVAEGELSSPK